MPSNIVDRVAGLNVEGNGLASQGLHEDLHRCCKCRIETVSGTQGDRKSYSRLGRKAFMHSVGWVLGVGTVQFGVP